MDARMTVIRSTPDGGSRFDEALRPMELAAFAPPAPPLAVSALEHAASVRFIGAVAGWDSPEHPAPLRQYVVMLQGHVTATVSSGEQRTFGPGDVVLVEDLAGRGHRTLVPGNADWLALVVALE